MTTAMPQGAASALRLRRRDTTDQRAEGRAWRAHVPRSAQAEFTPAAHRDPIGILREQNANRIPALVPIRRERMGESPFAFYRGAAAVMAADLAGTPSSGPWVQACGDAHLSNFGVFGSRDRDLIFDLNDFDETTLAPWEWDVKRLVASVAVLARQLGAADDVAREAASATAMSYRRILAEQARLDPVQRFYTRLQATDLVSLLERSGASRSRLKAAQKALRKAGRNTSEHALAKLATRAAGGGYRIVDQPPLTTRLPEFDTARVAPMVLEYAGTVSEDIAILLSQFGYQDGVVKVVGVGSVGTRCLLLLLADADGAPIFLQIKEASASVLERWTAPSQWRTGGRRVVAGQRMLQSSGDPFLGHFTDAGDGRSYYVRQFRDMKGSQDPLALTDPRDLAAYAGLCAGALARAHAQSGFPAAIAAYLGTGSSPNPADKAFGAFAVAYAAQNDADFRALRAASDADWYTPPA